MKSQPTKSAGKSSRRKTSKKNKPAGPNIDDHPDLQDRFTQDNDTLSRLHLIREHEEKMRALRQLHQAEMWSIREQLQIALFKMWNDMWLQKKTAQAKAHKDWLKVLAA